MRNSRNSAIMKFHLNRMLSLWEFLKTFTLHHFHNSLGLKDYNKAVKFTKALQDPQAAASLMIKNSIDQIIGPCQTNTRLQWFICGYMLFAGFLWEPTFLCFSDTEALHEFRSYRTTKKSPTHCWKQFFERVRLLVPRSLPLQTSRCQDCSLGYQKWLTWGFRPCTRFHSDITKRSKTCEGFETGCVLGVFFQKRQKFWSAFW